MNSRVFPVALFLLVSGMCALIFQTAWLREFRLIFGASTPASAAVLAIFMGGLGLGNAVLGRRVDASANPLKLYSLLELGISAASIASPFLIVLIRNIYFSLGGQESLGVMGATAVRLLLSTLVIGLPTFLMGGTLPAATRAVITAADRARGSVGWLYGCNTIGAVIGTLASTFFLLERLGNRETLWAAAAINIINAMLAWVLAKQWAPAQEIPKKHGAEAARQTEGDRRHEATEGAAASIVKGESAAPAWLLYLAAAVVGFAFLLMELVWYRMLGPILGGTTFTFGIILAVALAGIGIGGALYPILFRERVPSLRDFALTCGWEALALAIPFALGDRLALLTIVLRGLAYFDFGGQAAAWMIVAGIVVFPAALISGLQFPLIIALLGRGSRDVGKQVGQATAFNTVGAMAGSLAGGFGLLPLLTAPGAWMLVVILLAGMSLVALATGLRSRGQIPRLVHPLAIVLLAVLCLGATGPTSAWRHSGIGAGRVLMPEMNHNAVRQWLHTTRSSILWEADGQESAVAVSANVGAAFIVNGKSDGNAISDAGTQIMFPMIGAMIHDGPRRSLVIGLGTGESAGWLAALPEMEHVDVVELEPVIEHVAEISAPLNHDVLRHPKVRLIYNDGREVLQTSRQQYDLIASEPSNPYRAGVANLYTLDFYESVRERLAPRGLFLQWLQAYEVDAPTIRTVLCTARRAFEHVEIWEAKPSDLVLVCSNEPFTYELGRLRLRVQEPLIREALRVGWRTSTVEGVLAHYAANENYVTLVAEQDLGWINTDNHNILEFSFARTVGRQVGFSATVLREEARQQKMEQPLRIRQGVDWEAVEDQRIAFYAGLGEMPLAAARFSGERVHRAQGLADAAYGAPPDSIIEAWNKQARPPSDIIEVSTLALAYASLGDERATPLIEQLRPANPLDAEALTAILRFGQKKYAESARLLAAVCSAMRSDATGQPRIAEAMLLRVVQLAEIDKQHAPQMYAALSQPFAVLQQDYRRQTSRWMIAQYVNDAAIVASLQELEPYVPWDLQFLKNRLSVYRETGNPRAARAERELREYGAWMSDPYVLRPVE